MKKYAYVLIIAVVVATGFVVYGIYNRPPSGDALQPIRIDDVVYGSPDGVPTISFEEVDDQALGTPFRPSEFKTTLGQSLAEGHSGTTVVVNSITTKDGNTLDASILGDTIVLHISPGKTNAEIIACTGLTTATKTFTGCTFGYRFDRGTTQAGNIKAHAPGETVIISNDDHYLTVQYATIDGTNVFSGIHAVATSSDAVAKIYMLTSPTSTSYTSYIWFNRTTGNMGFATSGSAELSWNTDGTTFTVENPLTMVGGELNLATSTYDFVMRDTNLLGLATSTISSGTASGNRIDDQWSLRWNSTTTKEALIINSHATTTGRMVIGSTAPTWGTVPSAGLFVGGSATTTGSINSIEFCTPSDGCTSSLPKIATSTANSSASTNATSITTMKTVTIAAGQYNSGDVIRIPFGFSRISGGGAPEFDVLVNGYPAVTAVNNLCTGGGTVGVAGEINMVFGSGNTASIFGSCTSTSTAGMLTKSISTTTLKFSSEAWNIDFRGKAASGDVVGLDSFYIIKY